jgi:membrane protein
MARFVRSIILAALAAAAGRGLGAMRRREERRVADIAKGRFSRSPEHMTFLGWTEIVLRSAKGVQDDRVLSVAAGVAFYALLSMVPGLSVLISVYGLFTSPTSIPSQIATFTGLLPDAARELIEEQAIRLANVPSGSLSITLIVSLALALWSSNAAVKVIFESLNVIYGIPETRSYLRLTVESFMFTLAGVFIAIVMLFVTAGIPSLMILLELQPETKFVLQVLRWPLFYAPVFVAVIMLYQVGPCRRSRGVVWILPGAIAASLAWVAASALFSWYVSTLSTYSAMYGSLATVVVVLIWLWISTIILLSGAEISAQIEHQIRT